MSAPLIPHDELIAKAWLLAAVPGLAGKVATTLPDPPWADDEFVQIMSVGGPPDPEIPRLDPVVTLSCFAMTPGSAKPPWGVANQLAMRIWRATFPIRYAPHPAVELDINGAAGVTGQYGRAQCTSVQAASPIRRLPSDPSQYAVYNLDLIFSWTPVSEVFA